MMLKEIAMAIREFFDELFTSKLVKGQRDEIAYLRDQVATVRIDKDRLQAMLNDVSYAGQMLYNRAHPRPKPEQVQVPGPKRWNDLLAERNQEIMELHRKEAEEKAKAAQN